MMAVRRWLTAQYDWTGLAKRFYTSKKWEFGALGGSRNDAVAGSQYYQAIQELYLAHDLHGGGDNVPDHQFVPHMRRADGDGTAGGNGAELEGGSSGLPDSRLHVFREFVQMYVSQPRIVGGVDHPDERFGKILVVVSRSFVDGSPGSCGGSGKELFPGGTIVFHLFSSFRFS
jgi:hypothetical protein